MDLRFDILLHHWYYGTVELLSRGSLVFLVAIFITRNVGLRKEFRIAEHDFRYKIWLLLKIFIPLEILGVFNGVILDYLPEINKISEFEQVSGFQQLVKPVYNYLNLEKTQALIGFRDSISIIVGLIFGPWTGFLAALVGGLVRSSLGGVLQLTGVLASVFLGVYAGLISQYRPKWVNNLKGVFWVVFIGTILHRFLFLTIEYLNPEDEAFLKAVTFSLEVSLPVLISNLANCTLFIWIFRNFEQEKVEKLKVEAELNALRTKLEPHFFLNVVADLYAMFERNHDETDKFVAELKEYFNTALELEGKEKIPLESELSQLKRFIYLKQFEYGEELKVEIKIPDDLLAFEVIPSCLIIPVQNAFKHGFKKEYSPYVLKVSAQVVQNSLLLQVEDNGCGIPPERLEKLGKENVKSDNGSGNGLRIMESILNFYEAKLAIKSKLGNGTSVLITQQVKVGGL